MPRDASQWRFETQSVHAGYEPDPTTLPYNGRALMDALAELLHSDDNQLLDEASRRYQRHYEQQGRLLSTWRPGARDLLTVMERGSGYAWHYLSHHDAALSCSLIDAYDMGRAAESIFCADRCACPCVRPGLLADLAAHKHLHSDNCVLLSDFPDELQAASDMGIPALALGFGRCPQAQLMQSPAAAFAASVDEVIPWLRKRQLHRSARAHGNVAWLRPSETLH